MEKEGNKFFQESPVVRTLVMNRRGFDIERFYERDVLVREVILSKEGETIERRDFQNGKIVRVTIYSEGCDPLEVEDI